MSVEPFARGCPCSHLPLMLAWNVSARRCPPPPTKDGLNILPSTLLRPLTERRGHISGRKGATSLVLMTNLLQPLRPTSGLDRVVVVVGRGAPRMESQRVVWLVWSQDRGGAWARPSLNGPRDHKEAYQSPKLAWIAALSPRLLQWWSARCRNKHHRVWLKVIDPVCAADRSQVRPRDGTLRASLPNDSSSNAISRTRDRVKGSWMRE